MLPSFDWLFDPHLAALDVVVVLGRIVGTFLERAPVGQRLFEAVQAHGADSGQAQADGIIRHQLQNAFAQRQAFGGAGRFQTTRLGVQHGQDASLS